MTTLQNRQQDFLAYLRNPAEQAIPAGFPEPGAKIYAGLLYNKFDSCLQACFPVCCSLLGETAWQTLVTAFIALHPCKSPLYRQVPDEFVEYLFTAVDIPLWLPELAHFEWLELALSIAEAELPPHNPDPDGWLSHRPVFAPVLEICRYAYPVARLGEEQTSVLPDQVTCLLGFRDKEQEVRFIELTPATARLLEILQSARVTLQEALEQIAAELNHPQPLALINFAVATLNQLLLQGAILGIESNRE